MQTVERSHPVESRPSALKVLDADPAIFSQCFGRLPFALRHKLVSSGLFTIDRLAAIAEKMIATGRAGRLVMYEGTQNAAANFATMKLKKPFAAAVSQLESSSSWIDMINIGEVDPELDELYRETIQDVETLLGAPIVKDVYRGQMNVFIASPHVVTPYHYDHGHNFLCQIANEKEIWLWDPNDREILSEWEIEHFYCGNLERPRRQLDFQRGREFRIGPGDAVHFPALAPHWVKNGPNVSISVAMFFTNAAVERRARVYQANRILRMAGLKPPPPGRSPVLDELRSGAIGMFNKRAPKNSYEAVFSGITRLKRGINRLKRPFQAARRILGRSRTRPN